MAFIWFKNGENEAELNKADLKQASSRLEERQKEITLSYLALLAAGSVKNY